MPPQPSVLIVDALEESQEAFRSALEARGVTVYAASEPRRGLELARRHQPDLLVLDLDGEGDDDASNQLFSESECAQRPLVVLGKTGRHGGATSGVFVAKPYHYAPVIRRIERLLDQARPPSRRGA